MFVHPCAEPLQTHACVMANHKRMLIFEFKPRIIPCHLHSSRVQTTGVCCTGGSNAPRSLRSAAKHASRLYMSSSMRQTHCRAPNDSKQATRKWHKDPHTCTSATDNFRIIEPTSYMQFQLVSQPLSRPDFLAAWPGLHGTATLTTKGTKTHPHPHPHPLMQHSQDTIPRRTSRALRTASTDSLLAQVREFCLRHSSVPCVRRSEG